MFSLKYKVEWFYILLPIAFMAYSFYFDYTTRLDGNYFSRSGSIMIYMAILLEIRQVNESKKEIVKVNYGVVTAVNGMSDERNSFQRTAIALSLWGTLVWGYGDLYI